MRNVGEMMRKGYQEEYYVKKKLMGEYGKSNILKIAIGGAQDFLVLKPSSGRIEKVVEVKGCHSDAYYPKSSNKGKDMNQFKRIVALCSEHSIAGEVWIKFPYRKPVIIDIHQIIKGEPIRRPVKES